MTFERFNASAAVPYGDDHEIGPTMAAAGSDRTKSVHEGIERLEQALRPPEWSEAAWYTLLKDMRTLADKWLDIALACGWSVTDLFGAPPYGRRVDLCGVAMLLGGRPVESIDADRIVIGNDRGAPNVFYRHSPGCSEPFDRSAAVPIWDVICGGSE